MEITTWADFGALTGEELDAYTPEELEALKTSIKENEDKLAQDKEAQAKKDKEVLDNQKIRAEKAESELKVLKKEPEAKDNLSLQDIRALQDVPDEDVEEVVEYAKFKKISIAEAKKTTTIQAILAEKAEFRKSAQAADTGKKIIPSKVSEDQVVQDTFQNNRIPEKGSDAAEKLFWSKHKR